MTDRIRIIWKSARPYLWPAAGINAFVVSLGLGAHPSEAILVSLSLCLLASYGFLLNDLWDRQVDRVNEARRLEHADGWTIRFAWISISLLLGVGLSIPALVGWPPFFLSLAVATGLTLYTVVVRRFLLIATLLSALLGTSPLWGPMILREGSVPNGLWQLLFVTYLMFSAREILLDVKDEEGDRVVCRHTLATVFGHGIAKQVAIILLLFASSRLLWLACDTTTDLSLPIAAFFWAVTLLFLYLTLWPASGLIGLHIPEGHQKFTAFITRSRLGMLVLSVLIGVLLFR